MYTYYPEFISYEMPKPLIGGWRMTLTIAFIHPSKLTHFPNIISHTNIYVLGKPFHKTCVLFGLHDLIGLLPFR